MSHVRLAVRSLVRARWFAVGAAATFALGIGINVAVFASVDRLMFRPLPYVDADRVFLLAEVDLESGQRVNFLPARYVAEAQSRLPFIEDMATLGDSSGYFLTPDLAEPEIRLSSVTYRMLELGGVSPVMGRGFTAEDDRTGVRVAVLTHEGWQSRLGGDPNVLGRRIYWRAGSMEVVGVLPPGYIPSGGFVDPNIIGLTNMPEVRVVQNGEQRTLPPTVRLSAGVSREAAEAQVAALAAALDAAAPIRQDQNRALKLIPIREAMFGRYEAYLLLVAAGAGLVLLIACANLAGLFLVRGRTRVWDAAVRTALGATPARLMADALAESIIVCVAGAGAALFALHWSSAALHAELPAIFARFSVAAVDGRVLLFALAAAVMASLAAAVLPVIVLGRVDVLPLLQQGGPARTAPVTAGRWLLVVESALGVVLVTGAAVTARNLSALSSADLGFDQRGLYLVNMRPPAAADAARQYGFMQSVLDDLRARPDVESAGVAPFLSVLRSGQTEFGPDGPPCCRWPVGEGYLDTIRQPVVAGRLFGTPDYRPGANVALLNRLAVEQLWPGTSPDSVVGRVLRFEGEPARQVVGVVAETRRGYDDDPEPGIFLPFTGTAAGLVVVRARQGSALSFADVRPSVENGGGQLLYVRAMEPMYEGVLQPPRFRAVLFSTFAGVALLVALVGLYATASFEVARRQRELGVRLALGASRGEIVRLVVVEAVKPVVLGSIAGVGIALWAAQYVESFLHGVGAREPGTLVFVILTLLATASVAVWFPARRAARTDPASVLRGH